MQAQEARLRAFGVPAEEASPGLLRAMRRDMLGDWLPFALADILCSILATRGAHPPRLADVLTSWGLKDLADGIEDIETEGAIDALRELSDIQGKGSAT